MVMQPGIEQLKSKLPDDPGMVGHVVNEHRAMSQGLAVDSQLCPVPLEICSHLLFITLALNSLSVLTRLCLRVLPILFQSK